MQKCGYCQKTTFIEQMKVTYCPACDYLLHAGCSKKHVQDVHGSESVLLRQGVVGAYGVIKWQDIPKK